MEKSPHPWTIHESLIRDAENLPIADVYGLKGDPIHEANVRLIAAAPILLEALQLLADRPSTSMDEDYAMWVYRTALKAIAPTKSTEPTTTGAST